MFKNSFKTKIIAKLFILVLITNLAYGKTDPLNSPMWQDLINKYFQNETFVFDDKNIILKVPSFADNPLQVPIYVDGSFYEEASEVFIFADVNAIIPLLRMKLNDFKPIISVNMKIAQGTPLRAAIKDKDGLWHIASKEIRSFGGGCSVPSEASALDNWETQLGKAKYSIFTKASNNRIKFSVFHPMDTGLFIGNPEFFINEIIIKNKNKKLATIKTYASISENPRFLLESKDIYNSYNIKLKDTDGNEYEIKIKD